jgi:spore coat protein U-like protein
MHRIIPLAAATAFTLAAATSTHANITGSVDAEITLEAGCAVNGQDTLDDATGVNFGRLEFGTHTTVFSQADAEIVGAGGFTVQCSPGVSPVLSFNAGENDGSGTGGGARAMENQTDAGKFVTYNLYSDAGRNSVIPINGDIVLQTNGALQTVQVYGRAFGASSLTAGTYSDIITVVLEL